MTNINVADLAKEITLTINLTGIKTFKARLWLASWVFRLGAWIAGVKAEIEA